MTEAHRGPYTKHRPCPLVVVRARPLLCDITPIHSTSGPPLHSDPHGHHRHRYHNHRIRSGSVRHHRSDERLYFRRTHFDEDLYPHEPFFLPTTSQFRGADFDDRSPTGIGPRRLTNSTTLSSNDHIMAWLEDCVEPEECSVDEIYEAQSIDDEKKKVAGAKKEKKIHASSSFFNLDDLIRAQNLEMATTARVAKLSTSRSLPSMTTTEVQDCPLPKIYTTIVDPPKSTKNARHRLHSPPERFNSLTQSHQASCQGGTTTTPSSNPEKSPTHFSLMPSLTLLSSSLLSKLASSGVQSPIGVMVHPLLAFWGLARNPSSVPTSSFLRTPLSHEIK